MNVRQSVTDLGFSFPVNDSFRLAVIRGEIPGFSHVHKFGSNSAVSTTLVPVCQGGVYRTPTAAATLAVISSSANDTAAGTGARSIQLEYLDTDLFTQFKTINTNGLTESTETVTGVFRLIRAKIIDSGTYGTQTASSQAGTLTIREAGAGQTWAVIQEAVTGFGVGQTTIGAYTVPAGKTAYLMSVTLTVDSVKTASFFFFARERANVITAPFAPMQVKNIYKGLSGLAQLEHFTYDAYPEYTDIGFLALAPVSADCSVEFELILIDN